MQVKQLFILLNWSTLSSGVGPELQARARLIKNLPEGIFAGEPIPPKVNKKTRIEMSLSVRTIDLEFSTGTFKVSGWMTLSWTDDRYTWNPSNYESIKSVPLPFSKVWAPELILHNSLEEKFIYRQVGILDYTGRFIYVIGIHSKAACPPNFKNFPWGVQVCSLKFGSWINAQYNVEYRLPKNSTVSLSDFQQTVGWKVVNTKSRLESVTYPLFSEPIHFIVFDIAFKRNTYFDGAFGILKKDNFTEEL